MTHKEPSLQYIDTPSLPSETELKQQMAQIGDSNVGQLEEIRQTRERLQQIEEHKKAESGRIFAAIELFTHELPLASRKNGYDDIMGGTSYDYTFSTTTIQQARELDENLLWVPLVSDLGGPGWENQWPAGGVKSWTPGYVVGVRFGEANRSQTDQKVDLLLSPAFEPNRQYGELELHPPLMVVRTSMRQYDELTRISEAERMRRLDDSEYSERNVDGKFQSDVSTSNRRLRRSSVIRLPKLPENKDEKLGEVPRQIRRIHKKLGQKGLRAQYLTDKPVTLTMQDLGEIGGFQIEKHIAELASSFGREDAYTKFITQLTDKENNSEDRNKDKQRSIGRGLFKSLYKPKTIK